MDKNLLIQSLSKFLLGVILLGGLLFVPAGSFRFWQGWLLMGLLFIPMFIAGVVMMLRDPALLEKRLSAKEQQGEQREVIWKSGLMFITAFVLAGLNFRFGWLELPKWVVCAASVLFLLAYLMWGEVLRENAFLSRTVELQEGQKVVSTGLYGVVRHPMYMTTLILFLSMPLVLGSVISFVIMLFYIPIIVKRIKNEEKVLEDELDGYSEYKKKIRYRLIPFVW